jgi:hypothetical protein
VAICGYFGALRGCEIDSLLISFFTVMDTKGVWVDNQGGDTKNDKTGKGFRFLIPEKNVPPNYAKYISDYLDVLKGAGIKDGNFLRTFRESLQKFIRLNVGTNTTASFPSRIARFLGMILILCF